MGNQPIWWLLPDPHFNHHKLIKEGIRPVDYEQKITRFIKSHVTVKDILICLGDWCFYDHKKWSRYWCSIPVTKYLIRGNHDHKSPTWYLDNGFHSVSDELKLFIYGKTIVFSHKPLLRDDYDLNIHGHLHGDPHHSINTDGRNINLYLENHYTLFNLMKVVADHGQKSR